MLINCSQLNPGMTISIAGKLYRVESSVRVAVPKGAAFIKAKLKEVFSNKIVEKNFKPEQTVEEVSLQDRRLEFLYIEGEEYLFLDLDNLEQVLIPSEIIGDKKKFLKEGIDLKASFYGESIFSVELPQFLEIMVGEVAKEKGGSVLDHPTKKAILETGAVIEVPSFIEVGDIVKVDTKTLEYIQRV